MTKKQSLLAIFQTRLKKEIITNFSPLKIKHEMADRAKNG
jgi:hypothetical protein